MRTVRVVLYVLILSALLFVPLQRVEIAELEPIQAVWLHQENGEVILETDTGDMGIGATVEEAVINMKQTSSGIIYLDTAQYVFVSAKAQQQIPRLRPFVKASVRLCQWEGQGSLQTAKAYADARNLGVKLSKWETGSNLTELPQIN